MIDAKHGTSGPVWKTIQSKLKWYPIECLHFDGHSSFHGVNPNPLDESGLTDLKNTIADHQASIGISNDPDADRFVVVDEKGQVLSPEMVASIITYYLCSNQLPLHGITTTLASSHLLKKVAARFNIDYVETAVGFKYFTPHFESALSNQHNIIGVESSGGISLASHIFEKCGFLPGLLLLGICQLTQKSVSEWVDIINKEFGQLIFSESSLSLSSSRHHTLKKWIQSPPPPSFLDLFSTPPIHINQEDGLKCVFGDDSWCLLRVSGTEPVLRLYCESMSKDTNHQMISALEKWVSCTFIEDENEELKKT